MNDILREHLEFLKSLTKEQWAYVKQMIEQGKAPPELQESFSSMLDILSRAAGQTEPEAPAKRTRGPRRPTHAVVAKDSETIHVRSDLITQALIGALRDGAGHIQHPAMNMAERSAKISKKKGGQMITTIRPLEQEGFDIVLAALATLGDACVDTCVALMGLAVETNGTDKLPQRFLVNPDDILAFCGKAKTHTTYTAEQRAAVLDHLKTLSQIHITASYEVMRGKKRTTLEAKGPIITLTGSIGEYHLSGEALWEKRGIAFGEWTTSIPEFTKETAIMLRRVLQYSAKNERYQKRLGIYLTFMFRNNASKGCDFKCSMRALLEGAGITPPREIGKFKDAIEHALADLKRHGVIANYAQIVDANSEKTTLVEQHAAGWWDDYAKVQWRFEAPVSVKQQYRKLLKEGDYTE